MLYVLLTLISYVENPTSAIYMVWKGNWSISHEKVLTQQSDTNSAVHVNDYWAIVTKKSISEFTVDVYESPNNTETKIFNFSTDFVHNYVKVKDGNTIYTYNPSSYYGNRISISGKFRDYTFHYIFAGGNRYQISVFDFNNHEWNFFNIIKDVDRHDPTWFEENFWLMFGYVSMSILMFILYNYAFKRFSKLAEEEELKREEEKTLPKPEFEDVLAPTNVKRRTTTIYEEANK